VPTYAYACSACEHAFDVRQSISDLPLTTCPQCERDTLRKLFSPVGVVFKGSGFYRTDSRASGKGKPGGAAGTGKDGGGGAAGTGKDGGGGAGKASTSRAASEATTSTAGSGSTGAGSTGAGSSGGTPPSAASAGS
jgi:putative FmdB family regulatory protein